MSSWLSARSSGGPRVEVLYYKLNGIVTYSHGFRGRRHTRGINVTIAIFGGTGYIGSHLIDRLIAAGHSVRLLVRPGTGNPIPEHPCCTIINGDIDNEAAVRLTVEGCEAVVYLVGIIREFPLQGVTFRHLHVSGAVRAIKVAEQAGARRFMLMSANGARPDGTAYQRTKFQAEAYLDVSGLEGIIVRPSLVFGDPRGRMEFCTKVLRYLIRPPWPAPLFHRGVLPRSDGGFRFAPVHVRDVAAFMARAIEDPHVTDETFTLCGPAEVTWRGILETVARAVGRRKLMLPVPARPVHFIIRLLERFRRFPITSGQFDMLLEGNICTGNTDPFTRYGIVPTPFTAVSLGYLANLS